MAPADIRKEGSAYDLTIAMGILASSQQMAQDMLDKFIIMGELSLDGSLQRATLVRRSGQRIKEHCKILSHYFEDYLRVIGQFLDLVRRQKKD